TWAVDEKKWPRKKAAIGLGAIAFLIGIPSALSNGAVEWLTNLPVGGFLNLMFTLIGQLALIIGAFLISVFVGWVWGLKNAEGEVRVSGGAFPLQKTWAFLIRFVCPAALLIVLVQTAVSLF
ncbi:MAG: sodium-dependent transporter, partial [Gemmatimonadetes bacterium]|nr:sodium-dependent transporter [Gemmatimonadota bacterium]